MGLLRTLFGPSKEEMWRQLCAEIGAEFIPGGLWRADVVQARHRDWIITLDTYTVSTGKSSQTFTRLRAPFPNRSGFRFTISTAGIFTELGKLLGMQDLEIGEPQFDADFVIQASDPAKIRELLAPPPIRDYFRHVPGIRLEVRDNEGWFEAQYPPGVDVLYFYVGGVLKDVGQLRALFELFSAVLTRLRYLDSGFDDEIRLLIETLQNPGGRIEKDGILLWDGDTPRLRAASRLGELRETRAVPWLTGLLGDPNPQVRETAVTALGFIGHASAVPALIPLLGDEVGAPSEARGFRFPTADALRRLGQGDFVDAFLRALRGTEPTIEGLDEAPRPQLIAALLRSLDSDSPLVAAHAGSLLGQLGHQEALPLLRARLRRLAGDFPRFRTLLQEAIDHLQTQASLPRPAQSPAPSPDSLPLPGHR